MTELKKMALKDDVDLFAQGVARLAVGAVIRYGQEKVKDIIPAPVSACISIIGGIEIGLGAVGMICGGTDYIRDSRNENL